jgi:membrane protein
LPAGTTPAILRKVENLKSPAKYFKHLTGAKNMKMHDIIQFLKTDIWRIRLNQHRPVKAFFIRQLRVVLLALRGYGEDKCQFRASALTFYTLLSIVPVIAMMFGIAKGFGMAELVRNTLMQRFQGQEEVIKRLIDFSYRLLEETKGGVVAGIGVAVLFATVIKVLSNIENSFNYIWGVKKSRTISRKFSDYLSMMLICPVLLVVASSSTVFVSTQIKLVLNKFEFLEFFSGPILWSLRFLPFVTIWVLFTFIFLFMPNTKVKFSSGLLAGVVAGTIFQLTQWIYINSQILASKYGAIYGSFAALPLFLLWLQISWFIVLFGAEVSFAHQNVDTYEFEQDCLAVSYSFKKILTLLVAYHIVKDFVAGNPAPTSAQLATKLDMPIRLVRQITFDLTEAKITSEVVKEQEERETGYQPAKDIEKLTIKKVIDELEQSGKDEIPVEKSEQLEKLKQTFAEFSDMMRNSDKNLLLKNL